MVEKWGCEWEELKEKDEHVGRFVERLGIVKPLHERDGMFGGRTNAVELYDMANPVTGKIIEYKDVTSLYPLSTRPVGILLGIRLSKCQISCRWRTCSGW